MIKKQKGFSIIELLIYIGLLSIFLVVLTDMFMSVIDLQIESAATSAAESDSRYLFARLSYDISRAQSINIPANLGDVSSVLNMTIDGIPYSIQLDGVNLVAIVGSPPGQQTYQLNSEGTTISGISFRRLGSAGSKPSVRITYTLTSVGTTNEGPETRTFTTAISLR